MSSYLLIERYQFFISRTVLSLSENRKAINDKVHWVKHRSRHVSLESDVSSLLSWMQLGEFFICPPVVFNHHDSYLLTDGIQPSLWLPTPFPSLLHAAGLLGSCWEKLRNHSSVCPSGSFAASGHHRVEGHIQYEETSWKDKEDLKDVWEAEIIKNAELFVFFPGIKTSCLLDISLIMNSSRSWNQKCTLEWTTPKHNAFGQWLLPVGSHEE